MQRHKRWLWLLGLLILFAFCSWGWLKPSTGGAHGFQSPTIYVRLGATKWLCFDGDGVYMVEEVGRFGRSTRYTIRHILSW
jgi:hypothetical protein